MSRMHLWSSSVQHITEQSLVPLTVLVEPWTIAGLSQVLRNGEDSPPDPGRFRAFKHLMSGSRAVGC